MKKFLKIPKNVFWNHKKLIHPEDLSRFDHTSVFSLLTLRKNDSVSVLIDKKVADSNWISFYPVGPNYKTVIERRSFGKILDLAGENIKSKEVVDFNKL